MKIAIVGTGYVGLVTGTCLAEIGHDIVCFEKDQRKIAALERGVLPIFEPGLENLVSRNVAADRLRFARGLEILDASFEAIFIAVGTPQSAIDHSADLTALFASAAQIAVHAKVPLTIITKSTVPAGTGDRIERILRTERPDLKFVVVSNPEFLREGCAVHDFMNPDRIVVGSNDPFGWETVQRIYQPLLNGGTPFCTTSRRSAEVIKYASNAFLATKIAFANEMADLCEAVGAEIDDVATGMGLDRRIGREFLRCGPGYGGSCFPKDTEALLVTAHQNGVNLRLVESTIAANDARKRTMARRIAAALNGEVAGRPIALLGLTFKADTDDMRQSPSLPLVAALIDAGASVRVFDPQAMEQARLYLDGVRFTDSAYACAEGVDAVVLVTDWNEFLGLDYSRIARSMRGNVFIDLRNAIPEETLRQAGLAVHRLGRRHHDMAAFRPVAPVPTFDRIGSPPNHRANGHAY